jgi:hypothetical protein
MPLWHLTVTEGANPILLLWQPHVLGRADCHERRRPLVAFPTEVKAEEVRQKLLAMQKECLIELDGAVIAVKEAKGNIKLNQFNTTAAGAVTGAFRGTLIGPISNRLSWGCGAHVLCRRFRWRADSKLSHERVSRPSGCRPT